MRAREGVMKSPVLGEDLKKLWPLIAYDGQSDTRHASTTALELLVMAGYPHRPRGDDDDPRSLGTAHR
jgi:glutamate synthase domain-containing protein 1